MMNQRRLLKIGIIGAVITALCCITPALGLLLGLLGLSALVGALDYVLLPALLIFVALIIYALMRRSRAAAAKAEIR